MADPGQMFKNYAKSIIKMAAKQAAKSFLRYLIATFGLPALAITLAVILVLVTIFAVLPASGIPGSTMQTRTQAVAYYQQVTDQVNPQPQASLYRDLEESHLLNFGLLYAVDFFANNLSGANTFQSNAQALGEGLKPVFTYTQQTETITTIVSNQNGTSKSVTKINLDLAVQGRHLPGHIHIHLRAVRVHPSPQPQRDDHHRYLAPVRFPVCRGLDQVRHGGGEVHGTDGGDGRRPGDDPAVGSHASKRHRPTWTG